MPRKADAYVIEDEDRPGEYLVRPSCVVVAGGNAMKFRIRNLTGNDTISVQLPPALGADGPEPKKIPIADEKALDLNLKRVNGLFRYVVFVDEERSKKAKGESDPVIIIDPPAN